MFDLNLAKVSNALNVNYNLLLELNTKNENDIKRIGLNGKIKLLTVRRYEATEINRELLKGKPGSKYHNYDQDYVFNRKGNLIEKIEYFNDGKVYQRWLCIYNEIGKLIQTNYYNSYDSICDNLTYRYTYKYDINGLLIERKLIYADGSHRNLWTYKYDSDRLIEYNNKHTIGDFSEKWIYKYGSNGKLVEKNNLESNSNVRRRYTYQYDKTDRKILEIWYSPDKLVEWLYIFNYANNQLVEEISLITDDYSRKTYHHNEKGNKVKEQRFTTNDELSWYYIYNYDNFGNLIRKDYYNSSDKIAETTNKFEYNESGNLVVESKNHSENIVLEKCVNEYNDKGNLKNSKTFFYLNHIPEYITERIITHYE